MRIIVINIVLQGKKKEYLKMSFIRALRKVILWVTFTYCFKRKRDGLPVQSDWGVTAPSSMLESLPAIATTATKYF